MIFIVENNDSHKYVEPKNDFILSFQEWTFIYVNYIPEVLIWDIGF